MSNSSNISKRELQLLRGVAHDLLREASSEKKLDAREALENYAENLIQKLDKLEKDACDGVSYGQFIKLLAKAHKDTYGHYLRVVKETCEYQPKSKSVGTPSR